MTPLSAPPDALFEVTIIDGHNGSGYVRYRQTVLAPSPFIALGNVLLTWEPTQALESGALSIQVTAGHVWSGGYRNDSGMLAFVERVDGSRSFRVTEFDGKVTEFDSDVKVWTYLQDHHYQSVR